MWELDFPHLPDSQAFISAELSHLSALIRYKTI